MRSSNKPAQRTPTEQPRADDPRPPIHADRWLACGHEPLGWQERLICLAAKFPQYSVSQDLAAMTTAELFGVYRFLYRLASEV